MTLYGGSQDCETVIRSVAASLHRHCDSPPPARRHLRLHRAPPLPMDGESQHLPCSDSGRTRQVRVRRWLRSVLRMGGFRPNTKAEGEGIRSATKFQHCFRGPYGGQFLTLRRLSTSGGPEMKGQAMSPNSIPGQASFLTCRRHRRATVLRVCVNAGVRWLISMRP